MRLLVWRPCMRRSTAGCSLRWARIPASGRFCSPDRWRGSADAYSDLDLGVIVETGTVAAVAERCAALIGPLAHSTTIERGLVVDWAG